MVVTLFKNQHASISFVLFVTTYFSILEAKLPEFVNCVDSQCKEPISTGLTTQNYFSREPGVLSFKNDVQVTIYSKEKTTGHSLWGVKMFSKVGFIPSRFIKEQKILVKDSNLIIVSKKPQGSSDSTKEEFDSLNSNEPTKLTTEPAKESEATSADPANEESSTSVINQDTSETESSKDPTDSSPSKDSEGASPSLDNSLNGGASDTFVEDSLLKEGSQEKTDETSNSNLELESPSIPTINPNSVSEDFEVFEGTTFYDDSSVVPPVLENRDVSTTSGDTQESTPDPTLLKPSQNPAENSNYEKTNPLYTTTDVKSDSDVNALTDDDSQKVPFIELSADDKIETKQEDKQTSVSDSLSSEMNDHQEKDFTSQSEVVPNKEDDNSLVGKGISDDEDESDDDINEDDDDDENLVLEDTEKLNNVNEGKSSYAVLEQTKNAYEDAINTEEHSTNNAADNLSTGDLEQPINDVQGSTNTEEIGKPESHTEDTVNMDKIDQPENDGETHEPTYPVTTSIETPSPAVSLEFIDQNPPANGEDEFSLPKPESLIDSPSDSSSINTLDSTHDQQLKVTKEDELKTDFASSEGVADSDIHESLPSSFSDSIQDNSETTTFPFDSSNSQDAIEDSIRDNSFEEPLACEKDEKTTVFLYGESVPEAELPKEDLPFVDPDLPETKVEDMNPSYDQKPKELNSEQNSDKSETWYEAFDHFLNDVNDYIDLSYFGLASDVQDAYGESCGLPRKPSGPWFLLIIIAVMIVAIFFVDSIMKTMAREAPLLEAMNSLSRKYRVCHEENHSLKKQVTNSNGQIKTQVSLESNNKIMDLQSELDLNKNLHEKETEDLNSRIQQLEQDLEDAETNASEMHQMLDELLSEKKEATNFQGVLDQVQEMLDAQKEKVENLNSDLVLKKRLNEELQVELKMNREKATRLEHQFEQLTYSIEDLNSTKQDALKNYEKEHSLNSTLRRDNLLLQETLSDVEKENKTITSQIQKLRNSEHDIRRSLNAKEAELKVSKECLKKLKLSSKDGFKMQDFLNVVEIKAKLAAAEKENVTLIDDLSKASNMHADYEKEIAKLKKDFKDANSATGMLIQEKEEMKTKLEVLGNYFKEKETELTKELESKEGLRLEAEGSASLISNRIQNYESELTALRSQVETLKSELEEQKQSYKMQLINEEQKTQENWLSFRGAKRRQEELLQENGQLRQRLTLLQQEKTDSHNSLLKSVSKRMEANGSMSSPVSTEGDLDRPHVSPPTLPLDMDGHLPPLPPHMLPPLFHGGHPPPLPHGLPPPPPPPFLGGLPLHLPDRRLPPAGRIASPPFRRHRSPPGGYDRRSYSPSSDHSHYSDQYSPGGRSSSGQRHHSPDRRSDRSRPYNSRSMRGDDSPPPHGLERHSSPNRLYNRSPDGGRHHNEYHEDISDYRRPSDRKGVKTSTPLGPNDR